MCVCLWMFFLTYLLIVFYLPFSFFSQSFYWHLLVLTTAVCDSQLTLGIYYFFFPSSCTVWGVSVSMLRKLPKPVLCHKAPPQTRGRLSHVSLHTYVFFSWLRLLFWALCILCFCVPPFMCICMEFLRLLVCNISFSPASEREREREREWFLHNLPVSE